MKRTGAELGHARADAVAARAMPSDRTPAAPVFVRAERSGSDAPCVSCQLAAGALRRGLCRRCRALGAGDGPAKPRCAVCRLADVRLLVRKTLPGGDAVLCGSHAVLAERTGATLVELVSAASPAGDRRGQERRVDDRRSPRDRRSGGRNGWLFACSRSTPGRRAADTIVAPAPR